MHKLLLTFCTNSPDYVAHFVLDVFDFDEAKSSLEFFLSNWPFRVYGMFINSNGQTIRIEVNLREGGS